MQSNNLVDLPLDVLYVYIGMCLVKYSVCFSNVFKRNSFDFNLVPYFAGIFLPFPYKHLN